MKKSIIFIVLIAAALFGCKSQQKATTYTYDDVYSSRSDVPKTTSKQKIQDEDLTGATQIASPDSSGSLNAQSALSGTDLSDNSYAARIKNFHQQNPGAPYNDEYYTSSADSSSPGGSSPDVNVYLGSSWGAPSFSFGVGFGWGDPYWGYPYDWYYPYSWYYPYYGGYPYYWGYPYSWYNPWYNPCCYYDYPYYGNGYGDNHYNDNYYYGQRRTLSSTDGGRNSRAATDGTASGGGQVSNPRTDVSAGKSNITSDQGKSGRTDVTAGRSNITTDQNKSGRTNTSTSPDKQRYTYTRSTPNGNSRAVKNYPGTRSASDRSYAQRQQSAPRYSKPGSGQVSRSSAPQTYSSPSYRQPKSSQEYINPRSSGTRENPGTRSNSNPSTSGKRYSSPGNNSGGYRSSPGQSGSNHSYSTPQRSGSSSGYSSPSRSSSPSYSSPSRSSSPGYSAPSRSSAPSGGSSGGSRSSGGSSGGGGGGGHRR
ncbi:MAG: hypothetical protein NTU98_12455 [Bacteroidetes bacterium]|nr:hypothetical protein [Bacteroidota bacterium]